MSYQPPTPTERATRVCEVAVKLAPSFRDKFDFSQRDSRPGDPSHFELLADISFKAAEAIVKKAESVMEEAAKKEDASHA